MLALLEIIFWVHIARLATRDHLIPSVVHLKHAPSDLGSYEAFFGVPITISQFDGLVFSTADAEKPFLTTNHAIWSILEPELNKRLQDLSHDSSFNDRVRACLVEMLASGHYAMADVASKLAMSNRTLHRRLKDEGTTFQAVLDGLREDLARHYLSTSDYSTAEIAFLLGYEESNSFYRAFRTWTGQTPEAVRSRVSLQGLQPRYT
jgi:AraC-like DNA-binding protein